MLSTLYIHAGDLIDLSLPYCIYMPAIDRSLSEHMMHRFWRHTIAANQPRADPSDNDDDNDDDDQPGVVLLKGLIGHEFDEDIG